MGLASGKNKKFAEMSGALGCLVAGVPAVKGKPGRRQMEKLRSAIATAKADGLLVGDVLRIVLQMELLAGTKLRA